MDKSRIPRLLTLSAPVLAVAALALPLASQAAAPATQKLERPSALTAGAAHVHGTSVRLDGSVDPHGAETTYYFQYGPTIAYGTTSASAKLPAGFTRVKVGISIAVLLPGDHYRLVATNAYGTTDGRDRVFGVIGTHKFDLPSLLAPTVFGEPLILTGSLTGTANSNRQIVLQASPYPYRGAFVNVGVPILTGEFGRFSFRVADLTANTEFRVSTVEPRPEYSAVLNARVLVRVTLQARAKGPKGLVRLYGTVAPAEVGARLLIQLRKPVRVVGKSGATTKFATQFSTIVRRGTKTVSRFSTVLTILRQGRYRAYVEVKKGALSSGTSASIVLGAAPSKHKAAGKKPLTSP